MAVSMKNLLEAGAHFGHPVNRLDPRMKKYIFIQRNGLHIIDLQKTYQCAEKAQRALEKVIAEGKSVLFVGTKKQSQGIIQKSAESCGMFYVNNRWLGGTLTNFATIKKSIARLHKLIRMEESGGFDQLSKKEVSQLQKEKSKLSKFLDGIKGMKELPGLLFLIDPKKDHIAIAEAVKMNIPIISVVDTNVNPDHIDYPIPGNDDAIRSISLFTTMISDTINETLRQEEKNSELVESEMEYKEDIDESEIELDKYSEKYEQMAQNGRDENTQE